MDRSWAFYLVRRLDLKSPASSWPLTGPDHFVACLLEHVLDGTYEPTPAASSNDMYPRLIN